MEAASIMATKDGSGTSQAALPPLLTAVGLKEMLPDGANLHRNPQPGRDKLVKHSQGVYRYVPFLTERKRRSPGRGCSGGDAAHMAWRNQLERRDRVD